MYILSNDTRIGQAIVLFTTTAFFLFSLPFYFLGNNFILPSLIFIIGLFFNWIASRNYYVYIQGGNFYIDSLYARKKVVSGSMFSRIEEVIPGYIYYYLYFKNGQRYTFSKGYHPDFATFIQEGKEGIINKMTQAIQKELA